MHHYTFIFRYIGLLQTLWKEGLIGWTGSFWNVCLDQGLKKIHFIWFRPVQTTNKKVFLRLSWWGLDEEVERETSRSCISGLWLWLALACLCTRLTSLQAEDRSQTGPEPEHTGLVWLLAPSTVSSRCQQGTGKSQGWRKSARQLLSSQTYVSKLLFHTFLFYLLTLTL